MRATFNFNFAFNYDLDPKRGLKLEEGSPTVTQKVDDVDVTRSGREASCRFTRGEVLPIARTEVIELLWRSLPLFSEAVVVNFMHDTVFLSVWKDACFERTVFHLGLRLGICDETRLLCAHWFKSFERKFAFQRVLGQRKAISEKYSIQTLSDLFVFFKINQCLLQLFSICFVNQSLLTRLLRENRWSLSSIAIFHCIKVTFSTLDF